MNRPTLPKAIALPVATFGALATSSAFAAIVYRDAGDHTVPENGSLIYFDLISGDISNSASSSAFCLWATGSSSFNWHYVYAGTPANGQILCQWNDPNYGSSKRLLSGADIGSSSSDWAAPAWNYLRYCYAGIEDTQWTPGNTGYLGLRVSDGSGAFNYGWAKVSIGSSSVTLHSFAVETTANTAIQAGAIPEPSTYAALTGLLAGSAVLYSRRRKRAA